MTANELANHLLHIVDEFGDVPVKLVRVQDEGMGLMAEEIEASSIEGTASGKVVVMLYNVEYTTLEEYARTSGTSIVEVLA